MNMSNFSFYSPIQQGYYSHRIESNITLLPSHNRNQYTSHPKPGSGSNGKRFFTNSNNRYESLSDSPEGSCVRNDSSFSSSSTTFPSSCGGCSIINNKVQLRFLNPEDYDIVKHLCEEWFPVEYPAKWFEAITSDVNLFSLAASLDGKIIGLIVAELKPGKDLNREDRDILCESQLRFTAAYILSLGVVDSSRRQGIASLLLFSLLNHLSTLQCKAVFLHVLTSNEPALKFYEKHRFRVHKFLPYYYSIGGRARDGFTYVLYLNGGHGPWGLQDYVQHFFKITTQELCLFPQWCIEHIRRIAHSVISLVR